MKKILVLVLLASQQIIAQPIIPKPVSAIKQAGVFQYRNARIVAGADSLLPAALYLQQQLSIGKTGKGPVIKLTATKGNDEGYAITMQPNTITIRGNSAAGVFYGVISLLQLTAQNKAGTIPCWNITDKPLYQWRGCMLDESRHFFGKEKVKQLLNQMAFYKLNRFHWHLTDQPGWRIEIKQYPRLVTTGGIGNQTDPSAPAAYYTQEDIKEIIAYAAARYITIVPEIDMPGHATAANRAYPEFSGGGSARYPEFTFNPGKEGTYTYLTNILKETDALFPSQMIHLGGDEVSFGNEKWMQNEDIKNLMAAKGLKDAKEVEYYFIRRMADSLQALGNKTLAWDEVTQASLVPGETIVFWWRHDQPLQLTTSLQKGYSVVLCPRLPFYFDFVQDSTHVSGRRWAKDKLFNSLKDVYEFSLAAYSITPEQLPQVLGIQANVWTETIKTDQRLDFMTFPRLCAFAEAAWTKPPQKNFTDFEKRLQTQLPLLKQAGIQYYDPFNPKQTPEPVR